ncbi:hypothetical protein DFA_10534 [Cavenderia fasciculata]|uniref:AB hydrolase-1 domain-containing protein n=1 Tax=Cavenderia fasciculata TaxID=261658 RepID=F4QAH3_CACFS|nr:uncharacterized protein DFA_10534 [Cavenderia fasciculata]EGG15692.1 hypothetical protein DFA_10534 [Cavenderia fasciculata]|eukprot:XP_004354434.1 hypothetical protein DFA_10534 [Cavenderia fasciculata]
MNSISIITILIILINSTIIIQGIPDVSNSFLGVDDPGVSHFPLYLGLKMHIRCYTNVTRANQYGPIALFDSGVPFYSTAWVSIIPSVLLNMPSWNISKACFIDRYGYGWSDSAPLPVTTQDYVGRLRESLLVAGLFTGKYILVGWSWGSIFVQTYSMTYPDEVVGILSIDGTDSQWGFIPSNQQVVINFTNTVAYLTNSNSLSEFVNADESYSRSYGWFPNTLREGLGGFTNCSIDASQQIFMTNKFLKTAVQELNIMVISSAILNFTYTLKASPTPLGDLPYVNIYSSYHNDPDWTNRQIHMASLSSNSIAMQFSTGHFYTFDNPTAIVSAISALSNKIAIKLQSTGC